MFNCYCTYGNLLTPQIPVTLYHLLADPNGVGWEPNEGAALPPNPAGELPIWFKEPNPPPPAAAAANPPKPPDPPDPPKPPVDGAPKPVPIGVDDPNVAAAGDPKVGAEGCDDALTPNIDGSRLYFFARLRNSCSSFPAYLVRTLSMSFILVGLCVW